MEIKKKENNLFEDWKLKRPNLIPDGIVNHDNYCNNPTKVLYILKEVNGGKNWDLRNFLSKGGRWRTWNNVVRWQFGIENVNDNSIKRFNEINYVNNEIRKKYLNKIAVVNLKKVSGSNSSKMSEIERYSREDRDYLKKQIKLYEPDVIICCGTGEIVEKHKLTEGLTEWKHTSSGIKYSQNNETIVIDYFHPQQYRIRKEKLYIDLIYAYLEIKNV